MDSLSGTREAPARHQGSRKGPIGQPASIREAPGKQERTNWTACKAPGRQERTHLEAAWDAPGKTGKDQLGQPGRHQGGRKGLIGQPGRQERTIWTAWDAPGKHGKDQLGQPGRHQGSTRRQERRRHQEAGYRHRF